MTDGTTQGLLAPSPAELRDELERLAMANLLGPEGGDNEELPRNVQVQDHYLVGMLAPHGALVPSEDDHDVNDDLADGEPTEPGAGPTMFPSSMGLTFAVEPGAAAIEVTANWGRYAKHRLDDADVGDDQSALVWRRQPCGGTFQLDLADERLGERLAPQSPDPDYGDVIVSGLVRRGTTGTVVTLFLVNGQQATQGDENWLFQAELSVAGVNDASVFIRPRPLRDPATATNDPEAASLDMLYRHQVELAAGHGTAVHVTTDLDDPERGRRITTVAVPAYEVPQTRAPSADDIPALADVTFDMAALADAPDLSAVLTPLVTAYRAWIEQRAREASGGADGLDEHADAAQAALDAARHAADRIEHAIALVATNPDAEAAFRFANRAMALQRIHTIAADLRRHQPDRKLADVIFEVDQPRNRSWRPFQLAFVLLNLPGLTDPTHPERVEPGLVDLLWFPTGGGKTEAYLGLCGYTLAIRRLQGDVAGHHGGDGVAILMRYTLRLLTAQQFQRAAALICACETLRRQAEPKAGTNAINPWGMVPFRIGLWVGYNVTPNLGSGAERAIDQSRDRGSQARGANPVQLAACPWCGNEITAARNAEYDGGRARTLVWCSDAYGRCPFGRKHSPDEGLPVVTVDDEIYRLLPGLVIATADKFAQLPWQGSLTALFGRVSQRCERHGYRSPDLDIQIDETDSHRARKPLPAARTVPTKPLRPPDLIIQDELHLMTGPLGSLTGLYETAVDELCTWEVEGKRVRPKVIASTATVRRAADQAHGLFQRNLEVFPPQGLDAADSFFARQVPTSGADPGRRYLGICAHGRRHKAVQIRVYSAFMAAAQYLYERHGSAADPWMTLVGYYSSLRELGGMRRLVDDDIKSRLAKMDRRGLGRRDLHEIAELTSRMDSSQIPETLDQLGTIFRPDRTKGDAYPIDVLLATNMISVGVDVPRLGLMVVAGQPKATAEYIQATSRVGRSTTGPGLVVTVFNWARPRDLSHYERFEHYHATFYRHVESTTLTPFAPRAVDRGLTGVFTALLRHRQPDWNANDTARLIDVGAESVDRATRILIDRAATIGGMDAAADVEQELKKRLLGLSARQARQQTGVLGYRKGSDNRITPLLIEPGTARWGDWTCPNSLREVEPGVNLLFDDEDFSLGEPTYEYPDVPADDDGESDAEVAT